jgi:hypothetical protein
MLAAVATMMVAVGVLAAWKDLPGLLIGRLITGVSAGLAAGTAITYLIELRLRGLSVPVIGAGVALSQGASAPSTVLGFAILVGLGVAVSGWARLARRS